MKLQKSLSAFALFFLIICNCHSQIQITPSDPTPEVTRYHFSYNHILPTDVVENEDISIAVYVENVEAGDEMRIHFRKTSETGFHAMPLGYNPAESRFEVEIDSDFHGNNTIEYYIEIFPVGLSSIRIPEATGQYNTVKVKKRLMRYLKPIFFALVICAPFIGAYMFSKIRKAHAKRRAEYERRIRSRRRQLNKEREKHYKEYLKNLSGSGRRTGSSTRQEKSQSRSRLNKDIPDVRPPPKPGKPGTQEKQVPKEFHHHDTGHIDPATDEELRRELDNILNRSVDAETVMLNKSNSQNISRPVTKPARPQRKTPGKGSDRSGQLTDDDKQKLEDLFN